MQNYEIYLKDILEATNKIEKSIKNLDKETFKRSSDKIDATFMRIQVIEESIKKLPVDFKKKYKEVKWKKFTKTRDIISHAYSRVNLEIIWDLVKNKIPNLKKDIQEIIKKEKKQINIK